MAQKDSLGLIITGGTMLVGATLSPREGWSALVRDGKFVAVGPADEIAQARPPGPLVTFDASGRWVMPGLIDAHVHVAPLGHESLPLFLASGVTTIRDVGGRITDIHALLRAAAGASVPAPLLVYSGPLIDGNPATFGAEDLPIWEQTESPGGAADCAERSMEAGAKSLKVYFRLDAESVAAVCRTAANRVPVTGHLGRTLASEAANAGISSIEHVAPSLFNDLVEPEKRFNAMTIARGPGFWFSLLQAWASVDLAGSRSQRLMELMIEHDVTLDPTLEVSRVRRAAADETRYLDLLNKTTLARWESTRIARSGALPDESQRRLARDGQNKCGEFVRRFVQLGGRVTAGTDVGAGAFMLPGISLLEELRGLVQAGLTPSQTVVAATISAAQSMRMAETLGSIDAGKIADLVILDKDPLADVTNLSAIHRVVREGEVYSREDILNLAAAGRV